ncbi:PREDICTED: uncharacterized protein LOC108662813 [Theobroma cacao]|uniref:Uncharacterized protein LOC108662813 n=1 Tax=Theobroma cacao TaxID=3641 RepID=A0AB32WJV8_THECC|nr:PREDICTED: uncharacterized protein LOC108662813 [Theobroma cacao]
MEKKLQKKFRALSFIQSAIFEDIFNRIMECETAKATWTKLHEEYVGTSRTRHMQAQNLRRYFDMMRMKESQSLKEYIDQILKLANLIKLFGEELKEVRVAKKIINNVPRKFEPTIASLLQSKDLSDISITKIVNALQAAELRISARDEAFGEKAFLAKGKGKAKAEAFTKKNYKDKNKKITQSGQSSNKKNKFKPCSYCKKRNHIDDYYWFRPDAKCKICSQLGHTDKLCKNRTIEDKPAQTNESSELAEEVLFMAQSDFASDFGNCEWLLDSGSSRHIVLFEAMFVDLDKNH